MVFRQTHRQPEGSAVSGHWGHWWNLQTGEPWSLVTLARLASLTVEALQSPVKGTDVQLHRHHKAEVGRVTGCHQGRQGSVS